MHALNYVVNLELIQNQVKKARPTSLTHLFSLIPPSSSQPHFSRRPALPPPPQQHLPVLAGLALPPLQSCGGIQPLISLGSIPETVAICSAEKYSLMLNDYLVLTWPAWQTGLPLPPGRPHVSEPTFRPRGSWCSGQSRLPIVALLSLKVKGLGRRF